MWYIAVSSRSALTTGSSRWSEISAMLP